MRSERRILTVGHSNHPIDEFIQLLTAQGVNVVVDVRSSPFSRYNPQFNQSSLANTLRTHGIDYIFMGRELGARSDDPSCYENGRVRYDRLAATAGFRQGIARVQEESRDRQVVLMCAEKEPLDCHRTLLVSRALAELGCSIDHILAEGTTERHEATLLRLLNEAGMSELDLFKSPDEVLAEAVARQEEKIAYVDPEVATRGAR